MADQVVAVPTAMTRPVRLVSQHLFGIKRARPRDSSARLDTNLWLKQQVPAEHRLVAAAEESAEYRVDGE
jgi:hypothetical protein